MERCGAAGAGVSGGGWRLNHVYACMHIVTTGIAIICTNCDSNVFMVVAADFGFCRLEGDACGIVLEWSGSRCGDDE